MAILAKPQIKASHWYLPDGTPFHSVMKKDGSGERPTTIKDARPVRAKPSVTNILGILAKGGLDTWKIKQAVLAALRSPKQETESEEYYIRRIMDSSMEQVADAADLGSSIHRALEEWLNDKIPPPDHLAVYVDPVIKWFESIDINVVATEKVLVCKRNGYAGTADVLFRYGKHGRGVIDFKTRKTVPGKEIEPYDGQSIQLSAYAAAHYGQQDLDDVLIANVYISTTEPGRMHVIKHKDVFAHYLAFLNCCALWRYLKDYDPREEK